MFGCFYDRVKRRLSTGIQEHERQNPVPVLKPTILVADAPKSIQNAFVEEFEDTTMSMVDVDRYATFQTGILSTQLLNFFYNNFDKQCSRGFQRSYKR
jgi:hypothetical protein